MNKITKISLLAMMLFLCRIGAAQSPSGAEETVHVDGTIVSLRGGIIELRPELRHVPVRLSVSDKTEIMAYRRVERTFLKPGMRMSCGGKYSEKDGWKVRWVEFSDPPIGYLKEKTAGLEIHKDEGWAQCPTATLKSVDPFVFTDDTGKEYTPAFDDMPRFYEMYARNRKSLLIGTQIHVDGKRAQDGVIEASSVEPDRDNAKAGTMFGKIVRVQGNAVTILPRYSTTELTATFAPTCPIQKQLSWEPEQIKVGDSVTFWGQQRKAGERGGTTNEILAIALLIGHGRYLSAEGDGAPIFLSGTLTSLEPEVNLRLVDGNAYHVLVTGQMPIAELKPANRSDLKAGEQGLFVLEPHDTDEGFTVTNIVLHADPWVGYGR